MSIRKDEIKELNYKISQIGDFLGIDNNYSEPSNIPEGVGDCFELSYDVGMGLLREEYGEDFQDVKLAEGVLGTVIPSIEEYKDSEITGAGFDKQQLAGLTLLYSEVGNYADEEVGDGSFEPVGLEVYLQSKSDIKENLFDTLEEVEVILENEEKAMTAR